MKQFYSSLVFILFFVTGCASNSSVYTSNEVVSATKPILSADKKENRKRIVGTWYGSQKNDEGGRKEWITKYFEDGTDLITFKTTYADGTTRTTAEVGQWGTSGNILFTSFRGWVRGDEITPADPSDPYFYDAYRILELTSEQLVYKDVSVGDIFTVRRVGDDFEFSEM